MAALGGPASMERLGEYMAFAARAAQQAGLPEARMAHLELALEEVLVNVISYAYEGGDGEVELDCGPAPDGARFVCTVRDHGRAFNPLEAEEPDLDADIDHRAVGGLGVFLVRRYCDHVDYARAGESNQLTLAWDLA